jgi:MraZ protein
VKYFVGTYENKIDTKGRISLPAPFRDIICGLIDPSPKANISNSNINTLKEFYIFKSPTNDTLEAGGYDLMQYIATSIEEQAPMFSKTEDTLSYIMESAKLITFDSTGRFTIPVELSEFADISNSATFVGKARRFQIWNSENYKQKSLNSRNEFAKSNLTIKKPTVI